MTVHKNQPQRGNILFLILLAVVLFAALSYAVTSSTNGGAKNASGESNKTKAAAILQWLDTLDAAILRMKLTEGIPIQNISFEYTLTRADTTTNPTYLSNPNCSLDTCRVFKPAGGNIPSTWFKNAAVAEPTGWLTGYPAPGFYDMWMMQWPYAGTDANDVTIRLMAIDPAVCTEINNALGITAMVIPGGTGVAANVPSVWDNTAYTITTNAPQLLGKNTFAQFSGNFCLLWHVVIIR